VNVVFFVDDERSVLDGLRRMLRDMRAEWQMEFFESGATALAAMDRLTPDVVVSDMRMPQMDGAAFLTEVQARSPSTARIVLSGHAELHALTKVMPVAHQLLSKPCDPDRVRGLLRGLATLRARLRDPQLARAISSVGPLPAIPEVLRQLLDALDQPEVDQRVIAALIGRDPGLSVRILQIANSGYFGLRQRIDSVDQAVVMIGARMLRCLILQAKLVEAFPLPDSRFSPADFGRAVATKARLTCQLLEGRCTAVAAMEAVLAADLGQLVLASRRWDDYDRVLAAVEGGEELVAAELSILGVSHPDVGAVLLSLWGEAKELVDLAEQHHQLGAFPSPLQTVHAVFLAEALVACGGDAGLLARRLPADAHARLVALAPIESWLQRVAQAAVAAEW
jgi:HD-like signal output (HDOD) protein/ActR/RegA family two-component response regulator